MTDDDKALIAEHIKGYGLTLPEGEEAYRTGPDGDELVSLGTYRALWDCGTECSVFEGDKGELVLQVVGSAKYGNRRAGAFLIVEGMDAGEEVSMDDIEPVEAETA